jgi:hypothetical protein
MSRPSRSVLLVAAVSLAGGVLTAPGAAYAADTTTKLTATQMVVALEPVTAATTAAAEDGWKAAITMTSGKSSGSGSYVVDPTHGIAYEGYSFDEFEHTAYTVAGKGYYRALSDSQSKAAVKMMGRPAVRYSFTPDTSLTLAVHLKGGAPTPVYVLSDDVHHPGTKTVHDDGSTDYDMVVDDQSVTLRVSPTGTLSGAHTKGDDFATTLAYTYGPQTITVPTGSAVIGSAQLQLGVWYLDMPAHAKQVSRSGAAQTRRAARGATVKVASLRKIVRAEVSSFNTMTETKMIKVKDVRRGVRVSATNPWTKKTVSYTITASGKKVVVRN